MRHKDERRAAEVFVESNRAKMKNIAYNELAEKGCAHPVECADDVVNDVSLALVTNWHTLRSPEAAMYTFTVHRASTHARTCRREAPCEIKDYQVPVFSRPGRDPEQMIEDMEFNSLVFSKLNEQEIGLLQLKFTYGMSLPSIAELLEEPVGTVTARYSRILKKLRKALKKGMAGAVITSSAGD